MILHLAEPVTDRELVALGGLNKTLATNTSVLTIGWGSTYYGGGMSNVLREVEVRVVSDEECDGLYTPFTPEDMICAHLPGKDSCQGDSGGPLVDSDTLELHGIVSFGINCGVYPGVYTEVVSPKIFDWITAAVGNNTITPPVPSSPDALPPMPTPSPSLSGTLTILCPQVCTKAGVALLLISLNGIALSI